MSHRLYFSPSTTETTSMMLKSLLNSQFAGDSVTGDQSLQMSDK